MPYTIKQLQQLINKIKPNCICGKKIKPRHIHHYPHPDGITIENYPEKRWIYWTCQNCGYELSLAKILHKRNLERQQ